MDKYLNYPEKYQPIGSVKGLKNAEFDFKFNHLDIKKVFLSKSNISLLTNSLYVINKQNGNSETYDKIVAEFPKLLKKFLDKVQIYDYVNVEYNTTGVYNWVEILKTINNDFIKFTNGEFVAWNTFIPTRNTITVGDRYNRKEKKLYELQAEDIGTIDYWRKQEIQLMNKHFRYNNKIPIWQTSIHTRRYDTANEGFRCKEVDRASLETPVYNAYDMSAIHDILDSWKKESWFGMS